nr:HNH endonuclease [Mycobacterium sp.]
MFDLTVFDPGGAESELVDGIAALERLKAAAAARQARLAAALDASRRAAEAEIGMPAERRGRGVAAEVALARRDSPARGGRPLGFAKAPRNGMPHTPATLQAGGLLEG